MPNGIKELIYENPSAAEVLVNTYKDIKNSNIFKVNEVC